jgi:hypothetical protein
MPNTHDTAHPHSHTQTWIIDYARTHLAPPVPHGFHWDRFVQHPLSIDNPIENFGSFSPNDGQSEVASVPANLPRSKPTGAYLAWVLHNPDFIYILFCAKHPPALHDKLEHQGAITIVKLLSHDTTSVFSATLDQDGRPSTGVSGYGLVMRQTPVPSVAVSIRSQRISHLDAHWDCFEIPRHGMGNFIVNNTLRMSISHISLAAIESVAWGSGVPWGIRADEMIDVTLHDQPSLQPSPQPGSQPGLPPWPTVTRAELDYDPRSETGRFRFHLDGLYAPEEPLPNRHPKETWKPLDPQTLTLRFNGRLVTLPARPITQTRPLPIRDGLNDLRLTSIGGLALQTTFHKLSGNHILAPSLGTPPAAFDLASTMHLISRECDKFLTQHRQDQAKGPLTYQAWAPYYATSIARAVHHLGQDKACLQILRDNADLCLLLTDSDGNFLGRHLPAMAANPKPWSGGAYDTGPAGELWVMAHRLLGDKKYLTASSRLVKLYKNYRVEFNQNYAGFALYHLAEHYRLTRDSEALDHALHYAQHCVCRAMLPDGFHAGHNHYTVYGGITTRGLAQLAQILPPSHPFYPHLRDCVIRMVNQLIHRLQPDGLFDAMDRNHTAMRLWISGMLACAPILDKADRPALDRVFVHMMQTDSNYWYSGNQNMSYAKHRLVESELVRYLAIRPKLLANQDIDPFQLW